jgi:acetoin utilization protein AcuB
MIAEELINPMIPSLKRTDSAQKALNWMEEFCVHQLPVVEDSEFQGMVSEEILIDSNDPDLPLADIRLDYQNAYVMAGQHFYEVIKVAIDNKVQAVAVLDETDSYMGIITVNDTIAAFAQTYAVQNPGGILILSMEERNYSLAEISRLVESNDTKVLSLFVNVDEHDPLKVKITLKFNRTDLSHIIATLERFGYKIIAQFHETVLRDTEKDRLDILLRYLNI